MALQRFTRRAAEAAKGTGEAKDALLELGLNARQLIKMPLEEQMQELAGAFEQVETDADKVRLAMKLFDSEGVALVNTLGVGRAALMEMAAEAGKLGIALSADAVEGVEKANDSFTRLGTLFKGLRDQTTAALAPALEALATALQEKVLSAVNETDGGIEQFAKNMAIRILNAVKTVVAGLQDLVNSVIGTFNSIRETAASFTGFFKSDEEKNIFEIRSALKGLIKDQKELAALAETGGMNEAAAARQIQLIEEQKTKLLDLALTKQNTGEIALIPKATFGDEIMTGLDGLIEKVNVLNIAKSGGENAEDDPVAKEQEKLTAIQELQQHHNDLLDQGKAQRTAFDKKSTMAQTKIVLGGLSEQLKGTGIISKKLGAIQKAAAIKKALIATYESATKAFAAGGGFPFGIPMAMLSIAQGMANVAAIRSQSFEGGGFTGHGSRTGGVDGKGGFPAILHPNETVIDHTKGSGRSVGGKNVIVNQTLNITTGVEQTVRAEIMNMLPQIQDAAKSAVAMEIGRGGSYSTMITGR